MEEPERDEAQLISVIEQMSAPLSQIEQHPQHIIARWGMAEDEQRILNNNLARSSAIVELVRRIGGRQN